MFLFYCSCIVFRSSSYPLTFDLTEIKTRFLFLQSFVVETGVLLDELSLLIDQCCVEISNDDSIVSNVDGENDEDVIYVDNPRLIRSLGSLSNKVTKLFSN